MATSPDRRERGSALMLMPAAVLVLLSLGAIAIDSAVVFMTQRALVTSTQAAVNDAVGYGLDRDNFTATGERHLDPGRVEDAVLDSLAAHDLRYVGRPEIEFDPDLATVTVRVRAAAPAVLTGGFPGASTPVVTAEATASLLDR